MATDPQTLLDEAKCFMCYGVSEAQAMELALLSQIANSSLTGDNLRITQAGDTRITQAGDERVWI